MKNSIVIAFAILVISSVLAVETVVSFAEEEFSGFSLDYCRLTPAPADPKAPEPGGVTAKYGFSISKDFKPYVGTGLAYSLKPVEKPGGDLEIVRAGVAGQAGFCYLLGENSSLNIDYKFFNITPNTTRGDSKTAPHSVGVGLEIKF